MNVDQVAPFVTVIMPIRNEARFIERSLNAVLKQDYPHERMEILISDGMSEDNTRALIQTLAAQADIPVTILDNPQGIAPTGFNIGLAQARGDILVRVDGHCEIIPSYVSACVRNLQENNVIGVGGPIETIGQNTLSEAIALAMSTPFGVGGSAFRTVKDRTMLVDTVAFPAYKRAVIDIAGFFDEELVRNQDDEYNYRLRSLGHKILLAADIRSKYYSRSSLRSLWKQYFQYGYWKVRVLQKHPLQMRPRQFVPFILVFSLVVTGLLAVPLPVFRLIFAALVLAYGAANLLAAFSTAARSKWLYLAYLPLIFAILHFSYGTGFALGLIRFYKRWHTPTIAVTPTT